MRSAESSRRTESGLTRGLRTCPTLHYSFRQGFRPSLPGYDQQQSDNCVIHVVCGHGESGSAERRLAVIRSITQMEVTATRIDCSLATIAKGDPMQYLREGASAVPRTLAYQAVLERRQEDDGELKGGRLHHTINPIDRNTGATASFTPSELVLLSGGRFASRAKRDNVLLLDGETIVSSQSLGEAMLAAAILANEKLGAIRLELKTWKWFLLSTAHLLAVEGDVNIAWPAHSLEDFISSESAFGGSGHRESVSDIVYKWLGQYPGDEWISLGDLKLIGITYDFWRAVGELTKWGMRQRHLLEMVEENSHLIFTKRIYKLPSRTAVLAAQESAEAVQELLAEYQQMHPQIWRALIRGICEGISRHEPSD